MTVRQGAFALGVVATLSAMLVSERSNAGFSYIGSPSCSKNADGSGSCTGSFISFRNSPGMYDYVDFSASAYPTGTYPYFGANLNNVYYYCSVPAGMAVAWQTALTFRSSFTIQWDQNANCTYANFQNASQTPAE
jgi:hypothetical protein